MAGSAWDPGVGRCPPIGRACPNQHPPRGPRHHPSRPLRHRPGDCCLSGELSGRAGHHANTPSLARHGTCGGVRAFSAELVQIADGVLGPSQWEPGMTFPNIVGPTSDWFLDSFQKQCDRPPDYMAAGSFATGLVLAECIRLAASLDDEKLRNTASDLDCNTFYGRFRIDSRTGIQTGHRVLLIRWQGGHKVVLPSLPS